MVLKLGLTKQLQIGVVGYVYDELGCDSGSGDRVGCFQSRVVGVGPADRLRRTDGRSARIHQRQKL